MPKYEYLVKIVTEGDLESSLALVGSEGWILACDPMQHPAGFRLIFYRPLKGA